MRPGSVGASWPSTRNSRSCASGSASSSSAPTPPSCGGWATRSRPSCSPRPPACPCLRGAAESSTHVEDAVAHAEADRLPAHGQGGGRRRRPWHPQRRLDGGAGRRVRERPGRGARGIRARRRAAGEGDQSRPPRRGADRRRRTGDGVGAGRARLLGAAPPPEGHRGVRQHRAQRRAGAGAARGGGAARPARRVPQRRHRGIPLPARDTDALVHGGQYAPPGRASGDRGHHRRRPRQAPAPHRCGRASRGLGRRRRVATRSRHGSTPRTRRSTSRPRPAASSSCACRPARACASTPASPRGTRSPPSSTRWWPR